MLLYNHIVPLNRDNHRNLKIQTGLGTAAFARDTHYVPLAGSEFFQAARDYPIVFAGEKADELGAVALLGLRQNENLFLDDKDAWREGCYVPAFVRRYPFVLAQGGKDGDYTVCLDDSFHAFSEEEGEPLFDDEGKDTEYLKGVINFLNGYRAEIDRTKRFTQKLNELDLLVVREIRVSNREQKNFLLRDLKIVDESKLRELDDSTIGQLSRDGHLGWIYAHLMSIGNASRFPQYMPQSVGEAEIS
ncbi:SapC family protein [Marinobacter sp.]|uniref:SapC family protein n=1 Tax=Marinobacter sp. TaxID=50741 RepID=UPI0035639481